MKISVERVDPDRRQSIWAYSYDFMSRDQPYHMHDEYEIAMVDGCDGLLFCGGEIHTFTSGDVFLFGGRILHRFMSAPGQTGAATAWVIQFRRDALGRGFFHLPENRELRELLDRSERGLAFRGRHGLKPTLVSEAGERRRISAFLTLLADMTERSDSTGIEDLDPSFRASDERSRDAARLADLQLYIESFYNSGASLDGAADRLALTRTSLCRFVRRSTGRTFSDLLNDYRLTVAALNLRHPDVPVAVAAVDAGFSNLSWFNSLFRQRFGTTPTGYRATFR